MGDEAEAGAAVVEADAGELTAGREGIAVVAPALAWAKVDDAVAVADAGPDGIGCGGLAGHIIDPFPRVGGLC